MEEKVFRVGTIESQKGLADALDRRKEQQAPCPKRRPHGDGGKRHVKGSLKIPFSKKGCRQRTTFHISRRDRGREDVRKGGITPTNEGGKIMLADIKGKKESLLVGHLFKGRGSQLGGGFGEEDLRGKELGEALNLV